MLEADVQFIGNDGGQRGFAQPGRTGEQHVVQRLAAGFGGFQGDSELLFGFGLADELDQPARAQFEFKALLFVGARGADQPFGSVVAGNGHAEEKCSRSRLRWAKSGWPLGFPIGKPSAADAGLLQRASSRRIAY